MKENWINILLLHLYAWFNYKSQWSESKLANSIHSVSVTIKLVRSLGLLITGYNVLSLKHGDCRWRNQSAPFVLIHHYHSTFITHYANVLIKQKILVWFIGQNRFRKLLGQFAYLYVLKVCTVFVSVYLCAQAQAHEMWLFYPFHGHIQLFKPNKVDTNRPP